MVENMNDSTSRERDAIRDDQLAKLGYLHGTIARALKYARANPIERAKALKGLPVGKQVISICSSTSCLIRALSETVTTCARKSTCRSTRRCWVAIRPRYR